MSLQMEKFFLAVLWGHNIIWRVSTTLKTNKQTQQFFDEIGADEHSLHKRSLKNIVESEWFQQRIPQSWQLAGLREGKLSVCSSYCGKEFNKLDSITYNRSSRP